MSAVSHSGDMSTSHASRRLSRPVRIKRPALARSRPRTPLSPLPAAIMRCPAHQRITRQEAEPEQRERRPDAEGEHGQRYRAQAFTACSEDRGRAERRADAGAPDGAEQQPDTELTRQARCGEAAETLVGPGPDGAGSDGEPGLQTRRQ